MTADSRAAAHRRCTRARSCTRAASTRRRLPAGHPRGQRALVPHRAAGASQETIEVDPEADLGQLAYVDVVQWVPAAVTGRLHAPGGAGDLHRPDGAADRDGRVCASAGPTPTCCGCCRSRPPCSTGPRRAPSSASGPGWPSTWSCPPRSGCPPWWAACWASSSGRLTAAGGPAGGLAARRWPRSRGASERTCCSPCSARSSDSSRWCRSTSWPSAWWSASRASCWCCRSAA